VLDIQYLEGLLTRLSQLRSFVVKSFHWIAYTNHF
jgi:hypothetical protein